jgi:hypothetical protein
MQLRYTVVYKVVYSFLAGNRKDAEQKAKEGMNMAEFGLADGSGESVTASILEEVHQGERLEEKR